jgi:glycosyltransferase involved in cell wall biosynthesis
MKILCVNSVISEHGGAEFAATSLAYGLADRGHEVHFLGAKGQKSQMQPLGRASEIVKLTHDRKIQLHYREFPRIYPLGEKHGNIRKLIWHVQDLAHPANEAVFAEVLNHVKPDAIILHNITAVGVNIWRTIRISRVPCIQVIHELSMICLNMARFRAGRQCSGLCTACRLQKLYRFSLIAGARNFAFVSPSHAMLHELERYVDLSAWRREVIPNPNSFIVRRRDVSAVDKPRLLYVGRLDPAKGVDLMLQAAERAHDVVDFDLDILGTGSRESQLRQVYADKSWIRFHGSVDQETVAEFMSHSAALLVPSLWFENAPVVMVHALFAGLPVLGSRIGGIPEHALDGVTGRLLPSGDENAWSAEMVRVVEDKQQIATWSAASVQNAQRFAPELALDDYERLMREMAT